MEFLENWWWLLLVVAVGLPFLLRCTISGFRRKRTDRTEPDVALDVVRADIIRRQHEHEVLQRVGDAGPWEAFDEFRKDDQQEIQYRKRALAVLAQPSIARAAGLHPAEAERLAEVIQRRLGLVQPSTIRTIALDPDVIQAFKDYQASGHGGHAEHELFDAISVAIVRASAGYR